MRELTGVRTRILNNQRQKWQYWNDDKTGWIQREGGCFQEDKRSFLLLQSKMGTLNQASYEQTSPQSGVTDSVVENTTTKAYRYREDWPLSYVLSSFITWLQGGNFKHFTTFHKIFSIKSNYLLWISKFKPDPKVSLHFYKTGTAV